MAQNLPIHKEDFANADNVGQWGMMLRNYGCEAELHWGTMVALSTKKLVEYELVPSNDHTLFYEPSQDSTQMPVESFLRMCGSRFEKYIPNFCEKWCFEGQRHCGFVGG